MFSPTTSNRFQIEQDDSNLLESEMKKKFYASYVDRTKWIEGVRDIIVFFKISISYWI